MRHKPQSGQQRVGWTLSLSMKGNDLKLDEHPEPPGALPTAGACFIYVSEDTYMSSLSRRSRLKAFRIKVAVVRHGPKASSETSGEEVSPLMRLEFTGRCVSLK